ncbi:MAG: anaerobic ribonucleoside-triphosphate reductase activating protein [Candidatus Sungbacteria bacterium]|nr:anaerobic ribonucleoside-triphosphate reductase activating protein [Candidatus Sungbacteria bacterium]
MTFGGWQKISLLDFPGKISSILFTNGCVFRCSFCYNPGLVEPPFKTVISEETVLKYLAERANVLEGVVITGGEPTIHADLPEFLKKIKLLGYPVKLDTCGYLPHVLERLIGEKLIDYVAMDIKAPLAKYAAITRVPVNPDFISKSINIIMSSGIPYEFRSTLVEGVHNAEDIVRMAQMILGADMYYLQLFRTSPVLLNPDFLSKRAPLRSQLEVAADRCRLYVKRCEIRG